MRVVVVQTRWEAIGWGLSAFGALALVLPSLPRLLFRRRGMQMPLKQAQREPA